MHVLPLAFFLAAATSPSSLNSKSTPNPKPLDPLTSDIDHSIDPGVDFFTYANGTWLKKHPIPASESGWGIGEEVDLDLYSKLRKISEDSAAKQAPAGTDIQKVGDFWKTAMDTFKAEKLGLSPVKPALDRIDTITDLAGALDLGFDFQRSGIDAFFGFGVEQDEKRSDLMAVYLEQGGIGLPDRDFYFNPEAGVAKIRTEYVKYIGQILRLAGDPSPDASAVQVMDFETSLAKISRKLEDLREPELNYHKMPTEEVTARLTPSIDWAARFAKWKIEPKTVIVGQPEFYTGLETLLTKTPLSTLKAYLRFHLVSSAAPFLNREADAVNFHFEHEVLSGQKEPRPRWKRTIDSENGALGFVLGRVFVKDYFPLAEKKRYADMVEAFREAYAERIHRLTWMSHATKVEALKKLAAVHKKVGFPDHWKDYSKLQIGTVSYYQNIQQAA